MFGKDIDMIPVFNYNLMLHSDSFIQEEGTVADLSHMGKNAQCFKAENQFMCMFMCV